MLRLWNIDDDCDEKGESLIPGSVDMIEEASGDVEPRAEDKTIDIPKYGDVS